MFVDYFYTLQLHLRLDIFERPSVNRLLFSFLFESLQTINKSAILNVLLVTFLITTFEKGLTRSQYNCYTYF